MPYPPAGAVYPNLNTGGYPQQPAPYPPAGYAGYPNVSPGCFHSLFILHFIQDMPREWEVFFSDFFCVHPQLGGAAGLPRPTERQALNPQQVYFARRFCEASPRWTKWFLLHLEWFIFPSLSDRGNFVYQEEIFYKENSNVEDVSTCSIASFWLLSAVIPDSEVQCFFRTFIHCTSTLVLHSYNNYEFACQIYHWHRFNL